MMARLFFYCPVKAAFVSKHLGIKISTLHNADHSDVADLCETAAANECGGMFGVPIEVFYVMPESMPALEALPKETKEAMEVLGLWPHKQF